MLHVLTTYLLLHQRLSEARPKILNSRFYELRYEDLVGDPMAEMRKIYDYFRLGDFASLQSGIEGYLKAASDHVTNHYSLSRALITRISSRCGDVFRRYGYDPDCVQVSIADEGKNTESA